MLVAVEMIALLFTAIGGVLMALPDIPWIKRLALSNDLKTAVDTLESQKKISKNERGFNNLVKLINSHNSRLENRHQCNRIKLSGSPYGNPDIKAGFEGEDHPARYQLCDWELLQSWLSEQRDVYRNHGIVIFAIGTIIQFSIKFYILFI